MRLQKDLEDARRVLDLWLDLLGYSWVKERAHSKLATTDPLLISVGMKQTREVLGCTSER